ncbi:MAG TPA: hypothetical protein VFS43_09680 [Polyangiaceae bacterium]|nr:hypothetical protein [Polyangiaceae bacterium]
MKPETVEVTFFHPEMPPDRGPRARAFRLAAEWMGARDGLSPRHVLDRHPFAVAVFALRLFGDDLATTYGPVDALLRLVAIGLVASYEPLGGHRYLATLRPEHERRAFARATCPCPRCEARRARSPKN